MKIDGATRGISLTDTTAQAPARPKVTGQSTSSQESVELSGASSQLQALEAGISQASDFDAAKVESIKQALSEGRYSISSDRIAGGLTSSTLELLAQQKP